MAKRDKLYTVNKWNKPLFEELLRRRLYDEGGGLGYNPYLHEDLASTVYGYGNTGGVDANVKLPSYLDKAFKSYSDYTNGFLNLAKVNYAEGPDKPLYGSNAVKTTNDISDTNTKSTSLWSTVANGINTASNAINAGVQYFNNPGTGELMGWNPPDLSTGVLKSSIVSIPNPDLTPFANGATSVLPTTATQNLASHLGVDTATLASETTRKAVSEASKKLAENLGTQATTKGANFFNTNIGKGLAMTAADLAGDYVRGLARNPELSSTTAARVGDVLSKTGSLVGSGLMATGYGLPLGLLAMGIGKTLGMIADQFGSVKKDNGTTDYMNWLKSVGTQGSNEALLGTLANVNNIAIPIAGYADGIFTDSGKNWAREQNENVVATREGLNRDINNAFKENNFWQLQHALNNVTAMGGKLNRCNCNKKSYGGYLNSATPTGFNFLSDLTNLQMQKNQNNQDMNTSLGNTFIGTPDTTSFFAAGGPIHIKKSHRGRLTELKKRTGKTEAELYNDGNPAHRKMVTFARNARKWKKAYGGFLNAANEFALAQLNMYAGGGDKNKKKKSNPRPITTSGAGYVPDYNDNVVPNLVNHVRFPMGAATNRRNPWWSVTGSAVNIGGAMLPAISGSMGAIGVPFGLGLQAIENRNETEYIHDYEQRKKSGQATTPEEDKAYQWYLNHPDVLENRRNDWKQMNRKANGGKIEKKDKDIRQYSFFPGASMYELGGTLLAAGSNWGRATVINEGGTHEESPYDGVQVGVDPEGTPNLVEENEVIWNDYVFSNRIECPKEVCRSLRVGVKKNGFTFAEVAKKLLAESKERPNDPISKKGLEANMQKLEDAQEEVKKKMEAEEAVEQFNSLPPELQVAIMNQEGEKAQNAVTQEQMAQELQNMPPEQQLAIAQQMAMEQALAQGMPQGQSSPEEQAMMQQQMAQQQMPQSNINSEEALALAAAMQQLAIAAYGGKLCFGGRKFAEGGLLNEQPAEQPTEQVDSEMAKYSDEELLEMINEYEEAANGEKKVTKGKLARLRKKAEKAERELERRNSQGENSEEEQSGVAEGQPQEPTQEQIQAAAQAQAQQQMMEGLPQEGVSPELAMMMQQLMDGQPLMSPELMAAMEMQLQQGLQYAYGGKLYLTGGELMKALGFDIIDENSPITLEDLGISRWEQQIDPSKIDKKARQKIYSKVTNPKVKKLIEDGYDPLDVPKNSDRWFEPTGDNHTYWGDAGKYKTKGYTRDELSRFINNYPYINYVLDYLDRQGYNWEKNLSSDELQKIINTNSDWRKTDRYLDESRQNRIDYITRRANIGNRREDDPFLVKWKKYGEFKPSADGGLEFILDPNKAKDFDKDFYASRHDGLLGDMFDVRIPAESVPINYELDENGNPTGKILLNTTGYVQDGDPYSFYTKGDEPFAPYTNKVVKYWKAASNTNNNTDKDSESANLQTVINHKPDYLGYMFGALPGLTGLGMMLAQGKPDTSGLEAIANAYASRGAHTVAPHLTHGLIKPAIIDPRVTYNAMNAQRLGTNRLLANTGATPSKAASILANDMNYQNQMGLAFLRDWLANREQEQKAAQFNRETATTNANILNQTDQFNANMLANAAERSAQLRYNAAKEKLDLDNAYRAGLLGNIGSTMTGLYNVWRDEQNRKERAMLAASLAPLNDWFAQYYGLSDYDPATGLIKKGFKKGQYVDPNNPDNGKYYKNPVPSIATQPLVGSKGGKLKRKNKRKGFTF